MRILLRTLVGFLAAVLVVVPLHGQTSWTIQASQVAGITNTTTTRNTLVLTSTSMSAGADAAFLLNITGAGVATGTLQVFLEDSVDGGTTWNDLAAFAPYTYGAGATTQTLSLYGRTDGPGLIRSIAGTTPAAGAEISETVPTGARWDLLAFTATLTTGAAVANRVPTLVFDDGVNLWSQIQVNVTQAASLGIRYSFGQGLPFTTGTVNALANNPIVAGVRLGAGHRIRSGTASLQAADQWSLVQYLVREWRDIPARAVSTEAFPAGQVRSGPWGDRIRVREVVTNIAGSPTGPTYTVTGVFR